MSQVKPNGNDNDIKRATYDVDVDVDRSIRAACLHYDGALSLLPSPLFFDDVFFFLISPSYHLIFYRMILFAPYWYAFVKLPPAKNGCFLFEF
jgi:hypothetical protein